MGYVLGMSTQIAVRLPDDQVSLIDQLVQGGLASSRTEIIVSAVEREIRRRMAERDAAILQAVGPKDDLDALVDWTAQNYA